MTRRDGSPSTTLRILCTFSISWCFCLKKFASMLFGSGWCTLIRYSPWIESFHVHYVVILMPFPLNSSLFILRLGSLFPLIIHLIIIPHSTFLCPGPSHSPSTSSPLSPSGWVSCLGDMGLQSALSSRVVIFAGRGFYFLSGFYIFIEFTSADKVGECKPRSKLSFPYALLLLLFTRLLQNDLVFPDSVVCRVAPSHYSKGSLFFTLVDSAIRTYTLLSTPFSREYWWGNWNTVFSITEHNLLFFTIYLLSCSLHCYQDLRD